jgi:hypothetical protein
MDRSVLAAPPLTTDQDEQARFRHKCGSWLKRRLFGRKIQQSGPLHHPLKLGISVTNTPSFICLNLD